MVSISSKISHFHMISKRTKALNDKTKQAYVDFEAKQLIKIIWANKS